MRKKGTTWMDLDGIMQSEISQTEKDKYYRISLTHDFFKKAKPQGDYS